MSYPKRGSISRRTVLAAMPAGVLAGATTRVARAQPAAADPVSFYLGQVLALATLQAAAVGRLRPLLAVPNTADVTWQAGASAESGVVGLWPPLSLRSLQLRPQCGAGLATTEWLPPQRGNWRELPLHGGECRCLCVAVQRAEQRGTGEREPQAVTLTGMRLVAPVRAVAERRRQD